MYYDGFRLYDIHTKDHDDRFKHSGKIRDITLTVLVATVLSLLKKWIYDVCHSDAPGGMITTWEVLWRWYTFSRNTKVIS
jgi:hypothetical protein